MLLQVILIEPRNLIDHVEVMLRDADESVPGVKTTAHRLPDPPIGVSGKLVASCSIEQFYGSVQSDVALLHQVHEVHTPTFLQSIPVLLSHIHNKPKIAANELLLSSKGYTQDSLLLRVWVLDAFQGDARLYLARELDLLLNSQQRIAGDFVEVILY
jgi:hypothetical protein